ncbi:MAG: FliM/FliN family flagellar motor switch protein [Phycisphaerales bacterium]|nr:FliM/FliN family flagellar motor switch protein [Phycisphaerae bacterium]NNF42200.1 FliM/FliN family flagellar motor switch protein [Phycisphaerales bacterium]NNM26845.1 FliM/FliN family flagellar motor switch protein [Phycisphaerales bacterium]
MPADLQAILKIEVPVSVQIASRSMPVGDVLNLAPGAIIELPKHAEEELEILVSNKPVGLGRAVKVGENFGIRVTFVGDVRDRIAALGGADDGVGSRPVPAMAG